MEVSQTLKQQQSQSVMLQTMQCRQLLILPLPVLQSFLSKMILENPFLELHQIVDIPCGRMVSDDWPVSWEGRDLELRYDPAAMDQISLIEVLRLQIGLLRLPEDTERQVNLLIQLLDEDGYLRESDEELASLLHVNPARAASLRKIIQTLSPKGLGARDLAECLLLQIEGGDPNGPLLRDIIQSYLPALGKHRYRELAAHCHVSVEKIHAASKRIRSMDPKPGSAYRTGSTTPYIYPDAKVQRYRKQLELQVWGRPSAMLQYDPTYLKDVDDCEARAFLRKKRNEALTLMHSLEMRYHVIEQLLTYLLTAQREFFLHGPQALHPLLMKTAAEAIGVAPSTITRCVQDKYIEVPWGIIPMRKLFSNAAGNATTCPVHVQDQLIQWISREDPASPFSDEDLAQKLKVLGIDISRRTVTKYREQLGLAGQRERRRRSQEEGSSF